MPGTLSPAPWFTALDSNGNPLPGALLFTYDSGTAVKRATYTDGALSVAHTNPIVMDSAGRAVIYLSATSYKFVLAPSTDSDPPVAPIKTVDPVGSIPLTEIDTDIQGVAGEDLFAGMSVFLSDGTGGLTAGKWYRTSSNNTYSSSLANSVGMIPTTFGIGTTGSIRLVGRITGLSALTPGALYYAAATAGSISASLPGSAGHARTIGQADTTTSLVLTEKRLTSPRRVAGFIATVGNVGAGEDILATHTAPAAELAADGNSYTGVFWGLTTNNANVKTLRLRVIEGANNNIIATAILTASETGHWRLTFNVERAAATSARSSGQVSVGPSGVATTIQTNITVTGTTTWANQVEMRLTGDATTNDDIQMLGGWIMLVP